MTAPLAHTAIGAKPSASTTAAIQRGGRPVANTNVAPLAMAAATASRVREVTVSSVSSSVPSTSLAISEGGFIYLVRLRFSLRAFGLLSRTLRQLRFVEQLGLRHRRCAAA